MGIYCNDLDDYSYEDYYFECNSAGVPWDPDKPGNKFMCGQGRSCDDECEVDFTNLFIWSDLARIPVQCFQSLTEETVPPYETTAPEPTEYLYTAKFSAEWSINRDDFGISAHCTGSSPIVNITCTNGQIRVVKAIYPTVSCTEIGTSVLECTDCGSSYIDNFSGVVYVRNKHSTVKSIFKHGN
jgi:hypothetical protein